MGRLRSLAVVLSLFSASCTTWFVSFKDGEAQHRKRWMSCAGRCDPAFQTLLAKEDTQAALEKLARALETVPAYEREIAAQVHWDRAVLFEARGEWGEALAELDVAVSLDGAPVYGEERARVRQRLGVPNEARPPRARDTDSLSDVDEDEIAEKCACLPGQREEPPDEATFVKLVEPGKGIGPIVLNQSTPDDVVNVYGCDCRVTKRRADSAVTSIDYTFVDAKGGVGSASHLPGRAPNASRPATFVFRGGHVVRIALNVHQTNLATAGGLRVRGTKADMTRALGDAFELHSSRHYEKYRYREQGIDVWIAHANDRIGSLHVFKP